MNTADTERAWVAMSCGDAKFAWRDYAVVGAVVYCLSCDGYRRVASLAVSADQKQAAMKDGAA